MKRLKDILEGAAPRPLAKTGGNFSDTMSGIGTTFNAAVKTFDKVMSGFGGADPGKKSIGGSKPISTKMQDRVPQEVPRDKIDTAPQKTDSVALQRQMAGDKSPAPQSMTDKLQMMKMKQKVEFDNFSKKMDTDFQTAKKNKLAPAENNKAPVSKTVAPPKPDIASKSNDVSAPKDVKTNTVIPKAKPADLKTSANKSPKTVKVEKGTTYEKIARNVAKERGTDWRNELKSIMKSNRQKATNLKIGSDIVIPEEYDQKTVDVIKNMKKGKKKC